MVRVASPILVYFMTMHLSGAGSFAGPTIVLTEYGMTALGYSLSSNNHINQNNRFIRNNGEVAEWKKDHSQDKPRLARKSKIKRALGSILPLNNQKKYIVFQTPTERYGTYVHSRAMQKGRSKVNS